MYLDNQFAPDFIYDNVQYRNLKMRIGKPSLLTKLIDQKIDTLTKLQNQLDRPITINEQLNIGVVIESFQSIYSDMVAFQKMSQTIFENLHLYLVNSYDGVYDVIDPQWLYYGYNQEQLTKKQIKTTITVLQFLKQFS